MWRNIFSHNVPWNHIIFLSCIIFTKLCKIMHIIQCQGILHDAICTCDFFFRDAVPFGKRMPALNILVGSQGQLSRWDILKIKNSFYFLSYVTSFEEPYILGSILESFSSICYYSLTADSCTFNLDRLWSAYFSYSIHN